MSSTTLKATFYGLVLFTFIAIAIFTLIVKQSNEETAMKYDRIDVRISKRQQRGIEPEKRRKYYDKRLTRKRNKVVILYWSKAFGLTPPVNFNPDAWPYFFAGNNCPIKCELTTDKRRVHEALALVVHSRNTEELPPKMFKNLTWILHSNENPIYTGSLHNPAIMSQFNYFASYRLDSDFPCPEFLKPTLEPPLPFTEKRGLVMVAMSNCEPIRTYYLAQLMKYINVDSYGACLKNKNGLAAAGKKTSRHSVTELQRKYKFTLVFPNADCDYYMTEKIYSALSAGSVPIWLGTDRIDDVLQWGNLNYSVIKVADFSSPKSLAEYIFSLSHNEAEYNKYLRWKYEGFQFPAEYYKSAIGTWWDGLPLYCRVCMRILEDPKGHDGLQVDQCDGRQERTVEKWLNNTDFTSELTKAAHASTI